MTKEQATQNKAARRKKAVNSAVSKAVPYVDEVIATKLLRDATLREKQFMNNRITIVLAIGLFLSMIGNFFLVTKEPDIKYFATDVEGKIKSITALDQPVQGANEVLSWIARSVTQAYTFSFANYREELQAARSNFTPDGWKGFEKALVDSGNLQKIIDSKFVTTAVPRGAPVLLNEGIIAGHYAYRIEVPIVVTYQAGSTKANQDLLIRVIAIRRSELEHPMGLGIAQIVAE